MFNIDLRPTFTAPVRAKPPGAEPEQSFVATFEALAMDDFTGFDLATAEGAKGFLQRALVGVDDVVDRDGMPVADSEALRQRIVNLAWCRQPLVAAYVEGLTGNQAGN